MPKPIGGSTLKTIEGHWALIIPFISLIPSSQPQNLQLSQN
ncbi:hypothetical protein [Nostoc sphaeroides]|uniref:Uncharacterized protein n=1 Tax=Nostoc sphaeroides CCNUC1 TaxID=2653204 RepID=A0A5P8W9G4_9NOSO|nr:hypothetical protein [Nostoc sphaeroides]QFS49171.1 hypothetical protein GXM_06665 [Nostoc sphaeroides CCNUC1]